MEIRNVSINPMLAMILFIILFLLLMYVWYRWAKSYALTLKAMQEFVPLPANWAYLLVLPWFNLLWACVLHFFIIKALNKMHATGRITQVDKSLLGLTIAILICQLSWFISPSLGIIVIFFYLLAWIKVVEIRKQIIGKQG